MLAMEILGCKFRILTWIIVRSKPEKISENKLLVFNFDVCGRSGDFHKYSNWKI